MLRLDSLLRSAVQKLRTLNFEILSWTVVFIVVLDLKSIFNLVGIKKGQFLSDFQTTALLSILWDDLKSDF